MTKWIHALRARLWPLALAVLAACGTPAPKPVVVPTVNTGHHVVTLTPESAGAALTIGMDQVLEVRLAEEPVRNLRWFRDTTSSYGDRGVLEGRARDPAFERERIDVNTFGGSGFGIWQFTPKMAGQQVLRFEYRYAGTAVAPLQTATYTITVH